MGRDPSGARRAWPATASLCDAGGCLASSAGCNSVRSMLLPSNVLIIVTFFEICFWHIRNRGAGQRAAPRHHPDKSRCFLRKKRKRPIFRPTSRSLIGLVISVRFPLDVNSRRIVDGDQSYGLRHILFTWRFMMIEQRLEDRDLLAEIDADFLRQC